MKRIFLVILMMYFAAPTYSQQVKTTRVSAGDDVAKAYSPQGFYRFPVFEKATLYYKAGKNAGQLFNYNILSGFLQFVGPKGDTLNLSGAADLDSIVFEKTSFLYRDGIVEVIAKVDSMQVLKKVVLQTRTENVGAYGQPNATASIVNIKSYTTANGVYSLILNQDIVLAETVTLFFLDKTNNLVKSSKSNLSKILSPTTQAKADAYLKQNKVNFDRENDVRKLMEAINN